MGGKILKDDSITYPFFQLKKKSEVCTISILLTS